MRKYRFLVLTLIILGYMALYMATSRVVPCDDDECRALRAFNQALTTNRPYVINAWGCGRVNAPDSLCVYVRDTNGIDWNRFADTTCLTASMFGFVQPYIFIIKTGPFPPDTLVSMQCP